MIIHFLVLSSFRDELVTLSLRHADGLSRSRSFYRKVSNASMSVKKNSQCLQLIYQVVSRKCWATLTAILSMVGYFVRLVACEAALGGGGGGGGRGGEGLGWEPLGEGSTCNHLLVLFQNVLPTNLSLRTAALSLSSARASIIFWSPLCKARSPNTLRTLFELLATAQPSWIFMTNI